MVKELTILEYSNYIFKSEQANFISSEYMIDYFLRDGRKFHLLGLVIDNKIVGAGLFVTYKLKKIFKIAKCNQGPLIDFSNFEHLKLFISGVRDFFKQKGYLFVELVPNFEISVRDIDGNLLQEINRDLIEKLEMGGAKHLGFDNGFINGVGRWFFVKDLVDQDLLLSFDNRHRRAINQALSLGVKIIDNNQDYLTDFINMMEMTAQRHNFNNRGRKYFYTLLKAFKDNIVFSVAVLGKKEYFEYLNNLKVDLSQQIQKYLNNDKKEGLVQDLNRRLLDVDNKLDSLDKLFGNRKELVLSGAIFVYYNREFVYLFGCSDDEYRHFKGSTLLQYHGMEKALSLGIKRYNFYGTMGKYCDCSDDGVYLFKRSFGGRVVEQAGNFRIDCNKFLVKIYSLFSK